MNFRTTIILIAVLLLGVGYLVVEQMSSRDSATTTSVTGKGQTVVDIKKDDVTRVVLQPAGQKPIELVKADGKWKLVSPVKWPADTFEAGRLAEDLTEMRLRGQVQVNEQTRSASGLDTPRYLVEVSGAGKSAKLAIGNPSAIGRDLYVRIGDQKQIWQASAGRLAETLDKAPDKLLASLRDTALFAMSSGDVKQLHLTRKGGQKFVLNKKGDDWQMLQPQVMPADSDEVAELVRAVLNLRADTFVADGSAEVAAAGLDQPQAVAWFSKQAASTQPATSAAADSASLTLGQYEDLLKEKVYVRVSDPPAIAKVSTSGSGFDKLLKAQPLDLRDRRVMNVDPAQVGRISILSDLAATTQPVARQAKRDEIILERKKIDMTMGPALPSTRAATTAATGPATLPVAATKPADDLPATEWELKTGKKGDAEEAKVKKLLDALHPLKVSKYLEPSTPATRPNATYTLTISTQAAGGAQSATHVLRLVDPGEGRDLVGEYGGLKFELKRDIIEKFEGDWANKPKAPEPPPPSMPPGMPGMPGM